MKQNVAMKKQALFLMTVICALGINGCSPAVGSSDGAGETTRSAAIESTAEDQQWTEQDIRSLFAKNDIPTTWTVTDCVAAEDNAYNCVGIVLFTDNVNNSSNVAFLREDGSYQRCGVSAKTGEESGLTYLGNGAVAFALITDEGQPYTCRITFSVRGSDVSFVMEDDL